MNKNKLTAALKRKALAAAVMVAVSGSAFADVTIYGIIDIGINGDSSDNDVLRVDGGEGTAIELPSIWGIKGSEDLGGGLTASFALESDLNASDGSARITGGDRFWARQSNVSLSNEMGTLTLGGIYSPAILAAAAVDPRSLFESQSGLLQFALLGGANDATARAAMGAAAGTGTDNTNIHVDVFLRNAIQVKFAPGPLSVALAYGAGEVAGDTGANSNFHANAIYSSEGITVAANYVSNKGTSAVDDSYGENQKMLIGAKYKMDNISISGHYMKGEANSITTGAQAVENEGYAVGLTYFSGNGEFDVAYYGTKNENSGVTDAENDEIIVAYRNNLTQRTTLYAKLCSSDRGANAPAGACIGTQGENDTYYGFGVFHKF
uniref:Outer membrane protein (Porin) n=1 Tax=uncultured beta proteobacterium HF0130_04F21 TaxID=710819 RepID=E0XSV0_9PROT|nr:outer membrane protein (porin) [uncultured beta proteobacterium HF0130_04F21]